jgi:K+-transporting ATPase KdpF subunit
MSDVGMLAVGPGFFLMAVGYCARLRTRPVRRTKMIFDYSLAAVVAAGLLCYLLYALLRPSDFSTEEACCTEVPASIAPREIIGALVIGSARCW